MSINPLHPLPTQASEPSQSSRDVAIPPTIPPPSTQQLFDWPRLEEPSPRRQDVTSALGSPPQTADTDGANHALENAHKIEWVPGGWYWPLGDPGESYHCRVPRDVAYAVATVRRVSWDDIAEEQIAHLPALLKALWELSPSRLRKLKAVVLTEIPSIDHGEALMRRSCAHLSIGRALPCPDSRHTQVAMILCRIYLSATLSRNIMQFDLKQIPPKVWERCDEECRPTRNFFWNHVRQTVQSEIYTYLTQNPAAIAR